MVRVKTLTNVNTKWLTDDVNDFIDYNKDTIRVINVQFEATSRPDIDTREKYEYIAHIIYEDLED